MNPKNWVCPSWWPKCTTVCFLDQLNSGKAAAKASTKSATKTYTKLHTELSKVTAAKYTALRHNDLKKFQKLWRREMDIKKELGIYLKANL